MFELLAVLIVLFFCIGVPVMLAVLITAVVMRRRMSPGAEHPPALLDERSPAALAAFTRLVERWLATGLLTHEAAAPILARLAAERTLLGTSPHPDQPLPQRAGAAGEGHAQPERPAPLMPAAADIVAPALLSAQPAAGLGGEVHRTAQPDRSAAIGSEGAGAAPPEPPTPIKTAPSAMQAALLSLGTRRTLLFLGAFLLVVSSLVLVVFNWASFPPIVQLGLLAGVTGGLWAGGAWMCRREDLAAAGRNLQAVAALLVPVVGFALSRPGLLALPFQPSWVFASGLSFALYLLAVWRTGRGFYSGLAAVAAASLTLALLNDRTVEVQLVLLSALFLPMQAAAAWLQRGAAPQLATGPRWVAHVGMAAAALAAGGLFSSAMFGDGALALILAIGAAYFGLISAIERWPRGMWGVAICLPLALALALNAWDALAAMRAFSYGALALAYLAAAAGFERRALPYVRPFFALAPLIGLVAIGNATDAGAIRLSYPLIVGGLLAVVALIERGRLGWLVAACPPVAGIALAGAGLLIAGWLVPMLTLAGFSQAAAGLAVIILAAGYFAGAHWWPGRLSPLYDTALHAVGAAVSVSGAWLAVADPDLWLPAAGLLAVVWLTQAALRRSPIWSVAGLGMVCLTALLALERAGRLDSLALALVGLAITAAYAIGGTLVRHRALSYWTWPAIGWAGVVGLLTLMLAGGNIIDTGAADPLGPLALLTLAGLLGLLTWQWRQAALGYLAAALLSAGALLSASQGFYSAWQPVSFDLAYSICALVFGLALLGQWLRRFGRDYALPYELAALLLLPAAPFFATGSLSHLTISFTALTLLYALAAWRYRGAWAVAAGLLSLDFALLHGSAWLIPGGSPAGAAWLIAVAASAQAAGALLARRRGLVAIPRAPLWAYGAAAAGAAGALALALGDTLALAGTLSLFTAVLALIATAERQESVAWAGGLLLAATLLAWHTHLTLAAPWRLAWLSVELLGLLLAGRLAARLAPSLRAVWLRPTTGLPLALGALVAIGLAPLGDWSALTVGLLSYSAALALIATLERSEAVAWAAGLVLLGGLFSWHSQVGLPQAWRLAWLSLELLGVFMAGRLVDAPVMRAVWLRPSTGLPLVVGGVVSLGLLPLGDWSALTVGLLCYGVTLALIATIDRLQPVAWAGAIVLLGSLIAWHTWQGVPLEWRLGWLSLELLGVVLIGWSLRRLDPAIVAIWERPTLGLPLVIGGLLPVMILSLLDLTAVTFSLASYALVLATLAVRERNLFYAYGAGAAMVGAALSQLAHWGFENPQFYVVPAGLYLLALGAALRHFQQLPRPAQLVETLAVVMLLGVTFGQAVQAESLILQLLLLCGEALLFLAYGALLRLRVPFVGGLVFFVVGVSWMGLNAARFTNQWVIGGIVGLLMIAAYVLLERHQERLVRAGRFWAGQLRSWT